MENANFLTVFMTGLLTGGLTCMAVQGGLLAATIAQRTEQHLTEQAKKTGRILPITSFLLAKLIAYTIFGALLGLFGSFIKLSIPMQIALQIAVVIFMLGTALNMLNIHPFFRYFVIQPPHFLTRFIRRQSKRQDFFAPAILGAFTVFIPCGTTQAMMALAITSGSPLFGAGILFAFILGTSPVFFILGYLTTRLGDVLQARFTKIAAGVIILISIFNLNNSLVLAGSPISFSTIFNKINCAVSFCSTNQGRITDVNIDEVNNNPTVLINETGYSPSYFVVKHSQPVKIKLVNSGNNSCASAFTIPSLGIQKVVPLGSSGIVTFKAPDKPTEIAFMCSMGMYRGTIKVI